MLLLVNALVNYFLILGTCFFTKETVNRRRFVLAAFIGSLFALSVLLPRLNLLVSALLKLTGCAVISFAAFGAKSARAFLRNSAALFLSSAVFAGLIALIGARSKAGAIYVNNFGAYIHLRPLTLVLLALGVYLLLCLYELLFKKPAEAGKTVPCEIENAGRALRVSLLADSGKQLKEPISGKEVIVLKRCYAKGLLSEQQLAALEAFEGGQMESGQFSGCGGFSIVPFRTVAGEGAILAFKSSRCRVLRPAGKRKSEIREPYIGFVDGQRLPGCDGLIGTENLEE